MENKPLCVSFEVAFSNGVFRIQRKAWVLSAYGFLLDAHMILLQNQHTILLINYE
jgi:hypothetical protein